ncbi:MAG TPA: glycine--tRNA ligase subunit alpha, partial [Thermoanaerobaculia bacterium]
FHQNEREQSEYSFHASNPELLFQLFTLYEAECRRLIEKKLPLPAYDYCLKCSHVFNLLDARGAISVTERQGYILRVRKLAHDCAALYLASRAAMEFPSLPDRKLAKEETARHAELPALKKLLEGSGTDANGEAPAKPAPSLREVEI